MSESAPKPASKLTAANLAALLCARVCHDLVGPVGAMETGLDLLNDEDNADMHEDAIELMKVGALQASAKLKFLRIAFGAGGSAPAVLPSSELEALVRGVFPDGKVKIHWQTLANGFDKPAARVLLNLVMLAMQTIPRGGTLTVKGENTDNNCDVDILATGPKARLDSTMVRTLAGGAPEEGFDGRSVQPFYTGMIAREAKGRIHAAIDGETVRFTAKFEKA